MGIIGDLWSIPNTFISSAQASAASAKSFSRQKELMEHQAALNYAYAEASAKNSPSWNRQGLETAGYNPMLAVQNSTSGANSSWSSPNNVNQDDISGITSSNATAAQAFNSMENLDKQTDSNVKLNDANARNSIQEAIGKEIHNQYLNEREEKELGQIGAQTDKLIRETSFYDQLAENMESQRRLQEMGINLDYISRIYGFDTSYNATKYAADKSLEAAEVTANQSGTNTNKQLAGDIAKTLVGAGLAVFVGNKIKLIKPVGDLIKVIPKNILLK